MFYWSVQTEWGFTENVYTSSIILSWTSRNQLFFLPLPVLNVTPFPLTQANSTCATAAPPWFQQSWRLDGLDVARSGVETLETCQNVFWECWEFTESLGAPGRHTMSHRTGCGRSWCVMVEINGVLLWCHFKVFQKVLMHTSWGCLRWTDFSKNEICGRNTDHVASLKPKIRWETQGLHPSTTAAYRSRATQHGLGDSCLTWQFVVKMGVSCRFDLSPGAEVYAVQVDSRHSNWWGHERTAALLSISLGWSFGLLAGSENKILSQVWRSAKTIIQILLIKLEVTQHVLNHAHLGTDGSGLWVCQIARLKRYRNRISPWIPFELHARVAFHSGPNIQNCAYCIIFGIVCVFSEAGVQLETLKINAPSHVVPLFIPGMPQALHKRRRRVWIGFGEDG